MFLDGMSRMETFGAIEAYLLISTGLKTWFRLSTGGGFCTMHTPRGGLKGE